MSKISLNSNKVLEGRNAKRLTGKAGLSVIKRGVKTLMKKYNRKIIKASNTTNSSNTTSSNDNTKASTLKALLNDDPFISAIPNDLGLDCKIHIDKNHYDFAYQLDNSLREPSISEDKELSRPNEKELNDIFDTQIKGLMETMSDFLPD